MLKQIKEIEKTLYKKIEGLERVDVVTVRKKHLKIVLTGFGRSAFIFTSATPSDHRVLENITRDAKKVLREAQDQQSSNDDGRAA